MYQENLGDNILQVLYLVVDQYRGYLICEKEKDVQISNMSCFSHVTYSKFEHFVFLKKHAPNRFINMLCIW